MILYWVPSTYFVCSGKRVTHESHNARASTVFLGNLPVERKNLISKHYTLRSKLEKWQLLDWGKLIWKWRTTFRNNLQNTSPILHTSHFPPFCLSHFLLKSVTLFRLMTTMIDLVLNTREDKLSTCQNPKQGTYLSSSTTTSVRYPNGH